MDAGGRSSLVRNPVAGEGENGWLRPFLPPGSTAELVGVRARGEPALLDALTLLLGRHGTELEWFAVFIGGRAEREYVAEVAISAGLPLVAPTDRHRIAVQAPSLERLRPVIEEGGVPGRVTLVAGVIAGGLEVLIRGRRRELAAAAEVAFVHVAGRSDAVLVHIPPGLERAATGAVIVPDPSRALRRRRITTPAAAFIAGVVALAATAIALAVHGSSGTPAPAQPTATEEATAAPLGLTLRPGPAPQGRQSAAWTVDPVTRETVVFGGSSQTTSSDLDDTWLFGSNGWSEAHPAHRPPERSGALMAPDGHGGILLFGGNSRLRGSGTLRDTWLWNGLDWKDVSSEGSAPVGTPHSMAIDTLAGTVVLITGRGADATLSRTFLWAGRGWTDAGTPTPQLELLVGTARQGVIGLSLPNGELAGRATTWRWTGSVWQQIPGSGQPGVELLTATLATLPDGNILLVEADFLSATGPAGGTWTFDGRGWTRHLASLPFFVRAFDSTGTVAGIRGPDAVIIGGGNGPDAYRRAAVWTGSNWQDLG
jgi:hypothetical protein